MRRSWILGALAGPAILGLFVIACEESDDSVDRASNPKPGSGVHEGGNDDGAPGDGSGDGSVDGGDGGIVKGAFSVAVGSGAGTGSDGDHTCAIAGVDRSVFCWGANDRGQIGNGKTGDGAFLEDVSMAVRVDTDETGQPFSGASDLSLSGWHSCVRKSDALYCWGQRFTGAQAEPPGANADRLKPRVIGGLTVKAVAAGGPHTCAIRTTGKTTCFGHSTFNELGRPNPNDPTCAAPFFIDYASDPNHLCAGEALDTTSPLVGATSLTSGEAHTCAIVNGHVFCWGSNTGGRLGEPFAGAAEASAREVVTDPGLLSPLDLVTTIAAGGSSHTCALRGGKVLCWGLNTTGELGADPSMLPQRPYAVAVPALDGVTALDVAEGITCAVKGDGVFCWGNLFGPAAERVVSFVPTQVKGPGGLGMLTGVVRVAVGKNHVCALRSDASVWCWGANDRGQLGDGTTAASEFPVRAKGLPE